MTMADQSRMPEPIALPDHGGDLLWASQTFDIPIDDWLDLSTGLNPWPYPVADQNPAVWAKLPTGDREQALLRAARAFYQVPDSAGLLAAPGTQALIQWLPRVMPPSTVTVIGPTYAEHATAWFRAGHEVIEAGTLDMVSPASQIVVVVNPNNPDGRLFDAAELLPWAGELAARGGFVLVDEAFGDLQPDNSLASQAGRPGLVVLKSFGKFFGLAGLRLGFAIGPSSMQKALSECLGPWAVAAPALEAGVQALTDGAWADYTRQHLASARRDLDAVLGACGLTVVGGTDLFRLISHDRASTLFQHLAGHGILTRVFPYNPQWLRVGLPGTAQDLARLEDALHRF